jgi:diadenosine tetraphosphate (Ap4A) HIT family hydrolase
LSISIPERISTAHAGTNPTIICRVPSGWAALCDMQYLRGYVVHMADPAVPSLNDLMTECRRLYLLDMALIGDALMEVTGAYRINYAIAGNRDPYLHTHIVPRYMSEPLEYRNVLPWSYPQKMMDSMPFDPARDKDLMQQLARAIQKRV